MELEEFPKFEFNVDTDTMDSNVLFDFNSESSASSAATTLSRPKPASPGPLPSLPPPTPTPVAPPPAVQQSKPPKPQNAYFEEDEPTFELPEFELPEEAGIPSAAKPQGEAFWELEDALQSKAMGKSAFNAPPKAVPPPVVQEPKKQEPPASFVFQETQKIPRDKVFAEASKISLTPIQPVSSSPPPVAPIVSTATTTDLSPVLERLTKLENLLQKQSPSKSEAALIEKIDKLESALKNLATPKVDPGITDKLAKIESHLKSSGSAGAPAENFDSAFQKALPGLLEQLSKAINDKLPEIVNSAADRLSEKVAAQFAAKLAESATFDTKELLTSIAWQVVPDVAEILVRRELEEIRRNI